LGLALTLGVTDRVEGGGAMLDLVSQNLPRLPAKLADGLCRRGGRENECRKTCQQKTADHGSPPSVIRAARMRRPDSKRQLARIGQSLAARASDGLGILSARKVRRDAKKSGTSGS